MREYREASYNELEELKGIFAEVREERMQAIVGTAGLTAFVVFILTLMSVMKVGSRISSDSALGKQFFLALLLIILIIFGCAAGFVYWKWYSMKQLQVELEKGSIQLADVTLIGREEHVNKSFSEYYIEVVDKDNESTKYKVAQIIHDRFKSGKATWLVKWNKENGFFGEIDLFVK